MPGVRRKKSRRKAAIKITKGLRKKKKIIRPAIGDKTLNEHWDNSKTLQQNLKDLGLAYDPNSTVGIPRKRIVKRKDILRQNLLDKANQDGMEVEKIENTTNMAVIEEFTKQASNIQPKERHIAPGEAKFLMELMQKHADDYKSMVRDKRNTHQHTSNQLRRKCEGLLQSSLLSKYKTMYPGLLPEDETMET